MIKEPTITLPELIDPQVPGSGEYTAKEALEYLDRRAALLSEQRRVVRRMLDLHAEAVTADLAKVDEDAAITAKIEDGMRLSYVRLRKEFKALYNQALPAPHVVRDAILLDLLENFPSYDADQSGGLSLKESKLSQEIYDKLSPTGELTREKIKTGISVSARPSKGA